MEGLEGVLALLWFAGFILSLAILIEFFQIGHRLHKIRRETEKHTKLLEDQTRYLAAISANLAQILARRPPVD